MTLRTLTATVMLATRALCAQSSAWQPSPGHVQIPIWPGQPPNSRTATEPESTGLAPNLVAGLPWRYVSNVSRPTLTVYAPAAPSTGIAVIVFPGGGYHVLAIDLEGTEICNWLTSRG